MIRICTKQAFRDSNLKRFKAILDLPEAKQPGGLIPTLERSGFTIRKVGKTTACVKGRAVISFKGSPNLAEVSILKP